MVFVGDQPTGDGMQRPHQSLHNKHSGGPRHAMGLRSTRSTHAGPCSSRGPTAEVVEESGGVQVEGSRRAVLSELTAFSYFLFIPPKAFFK